MYIYIYLYYFFYLFIYVRLSVYLLQTTWGSAGVSTTEQNETW